MTEPLVSVIIPSFNHAQYIAEAIESVRAQTYKNWELIIVDDGSSDNTASILAPYAAHPNITVILNADNRGQGAVLNQGLTAARGAFIAFLASDDWFLPNRIEAQIDLFSRSSPRVGVIYGRGARLMEASGAMIEPNLPLRRGRVLRELVELGNFVYPVTPLFRRECFDAIRFDESFRAEGEAIFLKIANQFEFDYVDEVVGVMRDHGYNIGKNVELMYVENLRYWNEFFDSDELPDEIKTLRKPRIARLMRLKGLELVALRLNLAAGRSLLIGALKLRPLLILDFRVVGALVLSLLPRAIAVRVIRYIRFKGRPDA